MIAYLKGRALTFTAETAILEVNGVGYELYCSGSAFKKIAIGEIAELYTYLQVKEDGVTLFGFATPQEKELFLKITSVPNVGPKLGISVLTCLTPDEFLSAVATADVKKLSSVKGLGKKTAEKIGLELHGKISAAEVMSASGEDISMRVETAAPALSKNDEEAVSALMSLGFTKSESMGAVKRAKEQGATRVEDIIKKALQAGM